MKRPTNNIDTEKKPGTSAETFEYGSSSVFLSDEECNNLIKDIQEKIKQAAMDTTDEDIHASITLLQATLHGLQTILAANRVLNEKYSELVAGGRYYTYYFKNPKETKSGEICLVLDGKPTEHIIPYETLEDLNDNIEEYIYDGNGEKYTPLISIVGDRQFLPVPWFIRLCVGLEPPLKDLTTKATKEFFAALDKVSNSINTDQVEYNTEDMMGIATGKNGTPDFATGVAISFDPALFSSITAAKLTGYDMAVFSAVCSCYEAGNQCIPIGMINDVLFGGKTKLNDKQKTDIEASLRKLMHMWIKLDMSNEATSYSDLISDPHREGPMILGYLDSFKLKGNRIVALAMVDEPLLSQYAKQKKQFASVPLNYLAVPVNNTKESIALKTFLLERILRMKRSTKMSDVIRYDTLLDRVAGAELEGRSDEAIKKRRTEILKKTFKILDHWKDAGLIEGYKENSTGRKRESVQIFLRARQKALPEKAGRT